MKTILPLALILTLLCVTEATAQSCLPGYIYWTTQAEIDSFQINNPACTEIEGNLFIKGNDITNLNGLSVLTAIDGYLEIKGNPALTSLTGLESLNFIGGNLIIGDLDYGNPLLVNLSGLNNVTSVGGLIGITNNDALENLTGLDELTSIGESLGITNNDALENLTGLDHITSIGGGINIRNNPLLINLTGMDQLTHIDGGMTIWYNPILVSLSGLENISSIEGSLTIRDNETLTDLSALDNLTTIGGGLGIYNNNALSSLIGLENVTSVGGGLSINENDELINLSGLEGLTFIGGHLQIGDRFTGNNPSLTSLTGLDGLTYIEGVLSVSGCVALTNLAGLENLDSIGTNLWIALNPNLASLTALTGLTSIGGEIAIDSNLALTSLLGLENIAAGSISDLYIYYNPLLAECEVQSICDYLAGTPGYVSIMNNASGCNDQTEVEEACESAGIPDLSLAGTISVFPNPAQSVITIAIPPGSEMDEIFIYNRLGQKIIHQDKAGNTVDVESLLPGMYVVEMIVDGIAVREKLVKL